MRPRHLPRSEGRRVLLLALDARRRSGDRRAAADLARRVRASKSAVSAWASGDRTPGHAARLALECELAIDPSAWDVAESDSTLVNCTGASVPLVPTKHRIAINLDAPLASRLERLRSRASIAGAKPSEAAVVVGLLERALSVAEAELDGKARPAEVDADDGNAPIRPNRLTA